MEAINRSHIAGNQNIVIQGVSGNSNFFINQNDEKALIQALQTWWDSYKARNLFVVILTSTQAEILQDADLKAISQKYGAIPEDWKPYEDEKAILELLEEYKQESGFTVKGLIINQFKFEDRKKFQELKDNFAEKTILITDGIAILKKENKDWQKIFDQKVVGGFLVPICETTPQITRKAILKNFEEEIEETYRRFYSMWNEAYINIELDIPSKNLFFRRLTNIAVKVLEIKSIADMSAVFSPYATEGTKKARPDA